MTIFGRSLGEVRNHRSVPNWLVKGKRNHDRDQMNKVNVQHVIEQRHPAKHYEDATQAGFCFCAIKQSEQKSSKARAS